MEINIFYIKFWKCI